VTILPDNNAFGFTLFEHSIIMPLALQCLPICKNKQHIINRNRRYLKPKQSILQFLNSTIPQLLFNLVFLGCIVTRN